MASLTKIDIIHFIEKKFALSHAVARSIVEGFFEEICAALANGEAVKLSGFGKFMLRDKKARPGRNPRNKQDVVISARRVVMFHAAQKLKLKIEQPNLMRHDDE